MAKKSKVVREKKIAATIEKYRARRKELKVIIINPKTTPEDRRAAQLALGRLPIRSCPVRYRKRCQLTGRPRGYVGKFKMSRIMLRELALQGKLPGVTKSSW